LKDKIGKNVNVVEWYDLPVIAAADYPLSTVVIITPSIVCAHDWRIYDVAFEVPKVEVP